MDSLTKLYKPFLISNIAIFALGSIPVLGVIYLTWLLFIPAIGFSICNFIVAKDGRFNTNPWDKIIMILSVVALIPLIGWFCKMAALGFTIVALVKCLKSGKTQDFSEDLSTSADA